jgi:hypothetical protein
VRPLFEFRLPSESCPVQPSPPAAAGRHLSWASAPYSARGIGDPLAAGVAGARYGPPTGFGYPLGGLRPPSPCRLCFAPAALLGFTLRSFLLTEGVGALSSATDPLTVQLAVVPAAEAVSRPDEPRFPGFNPSESPWRPSAGLVRWLLVAPLGFALLGFAGGSLVRGFARTPPTRFTDATLRPAPAGASESRSAFAWFRPIDPADRVKPEQPF